MTLRSEGQSKFVWDDEKADANLEKHGVTFEEAMEIFEDPNIVSKRDERIDYGEKRWNAVGTTGDGDRTLVVAHTWRKENGVNTIRIISAWPIGDRGRRRYGYR